MLDADDADMTDRVEALLSELARLETRQSELLAELAAAGATPRCAISMRRLT